LGDSVRLRHGRPYARDYLVRVEHGSGNVEYRIQAIIDEALRPNPPAQPIISDFTAGDEGWLVEGDYYGTRQRPIHNVSSSAGTGHISSPDIPAHRLFAPLDLTIVMDTTESMGASIRSIKDASTLMVEDLRRRTGQLRIGLVSFKDIEADGKGKIKEAIKNVPLSFDVNGSIDGVQAWSASGGGDTPEDLLEALNIALNMDWRKSTNLGQPVAKAIMVITDAPPKINAEGNDGSGNKNTIASITALARQKGVFIYPVVVGNDETLKPAAARLARETGARTLTLGNPAQTAQVILQAIDGALDRSSPRYWIASQKFLGDQRRYYGTTIEFELESSAPRGAALGEPFEAPDVVLQAPTRTLEFRGILRPRPINSSSPWPRYAIQLDTTAGWVDAQTQAPATMEQILEVLGRLEALKIRAEHHIGEDWAALDNVWLGGAMVPTDKALKNEGRDILALLDSWLAASDARNRSLQMDYDVRATDHLLRELQRAGLRNPERQVRAFARSLPSQVFGPGSNTQTFYMNVRASVQRRLERLRQEGSLSEAETREIIEKHRQWTESRNRLQADLQELSRRLAVLCAVSERIDEAPVLDALRYRREFEQRARELDEAGRAVRARQFDAF
jgi:hypothetical protein